MWLQRGRLLAMLIVLVLVLAGLVVSGRAQAQTPAFLDPFNGSPSVPAAYSPPGWDVAIHSRDSDTWQSLEPMVASHGADCSPPPATFALGGDYPSHVYKCHDHLMTAINAGGYGVIYLTPPAMADFSGGESVIRWDMSTLRTSRRDWIDVRVTPYGEQLQLPLTNSLPDLTGEPARGVLVMMAELFGGTGFGFARIDDFAESTIAGGSCCQHYEAFLTPDAARRDTFELRLSRTHIKFWMPTYDRVWIDADMADLGWDQGLVQFGHHSYNPTKDCGTANTPGPDGTCQPNTWHWDNVSIAPAVPLQISRSSLRAVLDGDAIVFAAPAQAGDRLSFSAIGSVSLSFDGGVTVTGVSPQPSSQPNSGHFSSYFVPVPTGATSALVHFGPGGGYAGPFEAKDFAVYSLAAALPHPSSTPILTATTVPPTAAPTLTATPPAACEVNVRLAGIEQGWQSCAP